MTQKIVPHNAVLIPETAKRVFEGRIFDVYQWPQELYNDTTVTYEMLRRPDTLQIVAIKDGKLVVIDEQQPGRPAFVRLPGGRLEPDESWLSAAQRECREELGMEFSDWRLISVRQPIIKIEWFVATFLATDFSAQYAPAPDGGEHIQVLELNLAEWQERLSKENSPVADYAKPVFLPLHSFDELLAMPTYVGETVDR